MNVGRPREFNSEQALDAAMHLFWRKGYEATSMHDLLDTMQLSKSSLYQTFGNKHQLFQYCLENYRELITCMFEKGLNEAKSGKKFIEQTFMMLLENTEPADKRIGCLITNTAAEFSQRDPDIAALTKKGMESFTQVFLQAVKKAQQDGEISPSRDPMKLAYYLMANVTGINMMIKAGASQETLQNIASEVIASLN